MKMVILNSKPGPILSGPKKASDIAHECRRRIVEFSLTCPITGSTEKQAQDIVSSMFWNIPVLGENYIQFLDNPTGEKVMNRTSITTHAAAKITIPYSGHYEYLYSHDGSRYAGPKGNALVGASAISYSIHYERGFEKYTRDALMEFHRLCELSISRMKSSLESDDYLGKAAITHSVQEILEQRKKDKKNFEGLM